jgi:SAM-dependent methyltransferase
MTIDALHQKLATTQPVLIDLGCGPYKRPGSIGIDHLPLEGVDYVADIEQGLGFLPDNSVDEIYSSHLLEHINNFEALMRDIHRALKPGGKKIVVVPHHSNPYYYSDYTHKRFFGLYTFDYMGERDPRYTRNVPRWYVDFKFKILERQLRFASPFPIRHRIKQVHGKIFNMTPYMQELFESSFCYAFPCQEMRIVLTPVK